MVEAGSPSRDSDLQRKGDPGRTALRMAALRSHRAQHEAVAIAVLQAPDLKYTMVNAAYQEMLGADVELVGRTYCEVFPDALQRKSEHRLMDVLETGRPWYVDDFALEVPGRKGLTWWRGECLPLSEDGTATDAVLVINWDVTKRRRAEEALRERGAWIGGQRGALEAALNGGSLEESLGELVRTATEAMGPGTRAAFYLSDREGAALHHVVGMPADYAAAVVHIGPESRACGLSTHVGEPVLTTDVNEDPRWKPWVWLAERFSYRGYWSFPICTSAGTFVGTLVIYSQAPREATSRDLELASLLTHTASIIIARHAESEARAHAEHALVAADQRKDEFIATLSHELRNPLAPLRSALELLRGAGMEGEPGRPVREIMERQVNLLVRLVDDLMDVSRITRGALELRREPLELEIVLENALEIARPMIDAAAHELDLRLPPESLVVEADAVRLAQVFANLLNNAAKYTADGGRIVLEARKDGAHALVTISDTGDGIEAEHLQNLFELFSQKDRTSRKSQGGLGIGLALARRLVEMHGGTIRAESDGLGKGSRFTVRLPLGTPARAAPRARPRSMPRARHRALVVDDNRDAAATLGMLLEVLGADVRVVHDGPAALDAFDTYHPALVLLDIGMPGMDGYQVAREIRGRPAGKGVPLVALTGWSQEEDRRRAQAAGFDEHLVKPANVEALRSLLVSLDERAR